MFDVNHREPGAEARPSALHPGTPRAAPLHPLRLVEALGRWAGATEQDGGARGLHAHACGAGNAPRRAGAQPLRSAGRGRLRGTRLLATGTMGPEQGTHLPATRTSGAGDGRPGVGCLLKHPGERSGLTAGVAARWPLA